MLMKFFVKIVEIIFTIWQKDIFLAGFIFVVWEFF